MQPLTLKTYFVYTPKAMPFQSWHPDNPKLSSSVNTIVDNNGSITDEAILEQIFAACNHGSGRESKVFVKSNIRSMSVGDCVTLGNTPEELRTYECASFGWDKI